VALATPVAAPVSMAGLFAVLERRLPPRTAYNAGFLAYWAVWCLGVPLWVMGPRRSLHVLMTGRRPDAKEIAALVLPVVGALSSELLPRRRQVDPAVLAVMVAGAVVNAPAEELLWRGMFMELFPDDPIRGAAWPLAGFAVWHLAPQLVLPSRHGRIGFVLGAALVGAASTLVGRRTGGLRWVLPAHIATDACGVTAARFRLGRPAVPSGGARGGDRGRRVDGSFT
jgi:membrane protease YdiL (CAAX protease family)